MIHSCCIPAKLSPSRMGCLYRGSHDGLGLLAAWSSGPGSQERELRCSQEACFCSALVFSWQFACTDLWKACVLHSVHLQPPPANSPVLVHQVDLLPLSPEMGVFYVDEIIIADTNLTGDNQIHSPPWTCPSNAVFELCWRGCFSFNGERTYDSPSFLPRSWREDGVGILCPWPLYLSN